MKFLLMKSSGAFKIYKKKVFFLYLHISLIFKMYQSGFISTLPFLLLVLSIFCSCGREVKRHFKNDLIIISQEKKQTDDKAPLWHQ
jgi:hypothetical protein